MSWTVHPPSLIPHPPPALAFSPSPSLLIRLRYSLLFPLFPNDLNTDVLAGYVTMCSIYTAVAGEANLHPAYVDTNLVGSGKVSQAAILGQQGGVWATTGGFNVST